MTSPPAVDTDGGYADILAIPDLQRNRFANCCFPAQSIIQDREKIQSREDNFEFVVADYEAGCEFLSCDFV